MTANTKLATAVQILCVIAYRKKLGTTAEIIAQSLDTNPVVVRRMLKGMERHALVELRPGKSGGVRLAREANNITLEDIYRSVEENHHFFALRPQGHPDCPVDERMDDLLSPVFYSITDAVLVKLRHVKLADLVTDI